MIRDHIKTPIERLKVQINEQITEIWNSLQKPEGFENSTLYDFFDLDYAAIPHMILDRAGFDRECDALRDRFLNPECPSGWLLTPEHRRDIPADGFCTFAEKIWEVIKQNKDLDLPSQKHMLATYRCEELATEAYKRFTEELSEVRAQIEDRHSIVSQYGALVEGILTRCYEAYTQPASRYLSEVGLLKGEELSNRMHAEALRLYRLLVALASHAAEKDCEKALSRALTEFRALERSANIFSPNLSSSASLNSSGSALRAEESEPALDAAAEAERYRACGALLSGAPGAALEKFDAVAAGGVLPGLAGAHAAEWDASKERRALAAAVEKAALNARKEALESIVKRIIAEETELVAKEVHPALDAAEADMWARIRAATDAFCERSAGKLRARAAGLGALGDDVRRSQNFVEAYVSRTVIRGALYEKMKYLPLIMERRFAQLFATDPSGVPRRWNPSHDIPALFLAARDRAEDLLDLFCYMRMRPGDDAVHFFSAPVPPGSPAARNVKLSQRSLLAKPRIDRKACGGKAVVFDPTFMLESTANLQSYLDQFRRKAQNAYVQAVRDQEQVTYHTNIPMPYMVLLFVLGFNEIKYILSNPKLAAVIVVLATTYYVLYKLNYSDRVFSFITTVLFASFGSIKDRFFEYIVQQIDEKRAKETAENPGEPPRQPSASIIPPPKSYRKKKPRANSPTPQDGEAPPPTLLPHEGDITIVEGENRKIIENNNNNNNNGNDDNEEIVLLGGGDGGSGSEVKPKGSHRLSKRFKTLPNMALSHSKRSHHKSENGGENATEGGEQKKKKDQQGKQKESAAAGAATAMMMMPPPSVTVTTAEGDNNIAIESKN